MATYQDSPWWVAENLTNQNSFRLSNPFSNNAPSGYQAVHAGSQTDWNAFQSGLKSGNTVNLHSIDWKVAGGPYATEAAANAAIPAIQKQAPAPGALQQAAAGAGFLNPLAGLEGIAAALAELGKIIGAIFDPALWISLGWLGLGALLLIMGAIWWNKDTIARLGGEAAKGAAL